MKLNALLLLCVTFLRCTKTQDLTAITRDDLPKLTALERSPSNAGQGGAAIHGQWAAWTAWTGCSESCDYGTQNRTRTCDNPFPSNGGQNCSGGDSQERQCWLDFCKVDGGWSEWSEWSHCSVYCYGDDFQRRYRTCSDPRPDSGGKYCQGEPVQKQLCGMKLCPNLVMATRYVHNYKFYSPDNLLRNDPQGCEARIDNGNGNYYHGSASNIPQSQVMVDLGAPAVFVAIHLRNAINRGLAGSGNGGVKGFTLEGSMNGSVWEHVLDGEMLVDVRQMECNEPPVETTTAEEGQKKVIRFVRLTVTSTFAGSPSLFYMGFDHEPAPMETDFIQLQLPKIKEMSAFSAAGNYHLSIYSGGTRILYDEVSGDQCEKTISTNHEIPTSFWIGPDQNAPVGFITFDFGTDVIVEGVTVRNGQNGHHNDRTTEDFRIEVSRDEKTWTFAFAGTLQPNPLTASNCPKARIEKFEFGKKVAARFVKLITVSNYGSNGAALQYVHFDFIQPQAKKCPRDSLCPVIVSATESQYPENYPAESVLLDACEFNPYVHSIYPTSYYVLWAEELVTNPFEATIVIDWGKLVQVSAVKLKNTRNGEHNNVSTKQFSAEFRPDLSSEWIFAVEGELTDITGMSCEEIPLEAFQVNGGQTIQGRFMRLKLLNSHEGKVGVGLQFVTLDYTVIH